MIAGVVVLILLGIGPPTTGFVAGRPAIVGQIETPARGCSAQEELARIKADDPAYEVVREMGETLKGLGVAVRCVCASKMQHVFEGQVGAAWYRSDDGVFEIAFLPKGKSF